MSSTTKFSLDNILLTSLIVGAAAKGDETLKCGLGDPTMDCQIPGGGNWRSDVATCAKGCTKTYTPDFIETLDPMDCIFGCSTMNAVECAVVSDMETSQDHCTGGDTGVNGGGTVGPCNTCSDYFGTCQPSTVFGTQCPATYGMSNDCPVAPGTGQLNNCPLPPTPETMLPSCFDTGS